jgi:hypothetical protein
MAVMMPGGWLSDAKGSGTAEDPYVLCQMSTGARHVVDVDTDDAVDLDDPSDALWVGGAGTLKVNTVGGQTVTISGVAAGTLLPIRVTRVWENGTSATLIQSWRA